MKVNSKIFIRFAVFATALLFGLNATAQFVRPITTPVWYSQLKVGDLFWLATTDTSSMGAIQYPGALIYQQADSSFYFSNGDKWKPISSAPPGILDSLAEKLNLNDSIQVYTTPTGLNDSLAGRLPLHGIADNSIKWNGATNAITTPSSGQLMQYNGTTWINWSPDYLTNTAGGADIQVLNNVINNTSTLQTVTNRGATTTTPISLDRSAAVLNASSYYKLTTAGAPDWFIGTNPYNIVGHLTDFSIYNYHTNHISLNIDSATDKVTTYGSIVAPSIMLSSGATVTGTTTLNLGSDATGDTYTRSASGSLQRVPIGTTGQIWTVAGGLPTWATAPYTTPVQVGTQIHDTVSGKYLVDSTSKGQLYPITGTNGILITGGANTVLSQAVTVSQDTVNTIASKQWVINQGYGKGSGSGTVTSVGLSLPNIFSVSGSPITGSGTLTAVLDSQAKNLVFASPYSATGLPTFRSLVPSDLPIIPASQVSGLTLARDTDVVITTPAANQLLSYNGTKWINQTPNYLTTNQAITISGDVTGSGTTSIATVLKSTGTAGTYTRVTTDAQGRVSSGTDTSYAVYNGGNATGLWPIGITGNAATATNSTQWGGITNAVSTPSTGQVLRYNGTNWTNANVSALGIPTPTLQSVTDSGKTTTNGITVSGQSFFNGYDLYLNNLVRAGTGANGDGNSVVLGNSALGNTTGSASGNTAIGHHTAAYLQSGVQNVALGNDALGLATSANNIIAIGYSTLQSGGDGSVAIGTNALSAIGNKGYNVAIGYYSGFADSGDNNVFIGTNAGYIPGTSATVPNDNLHSVIIGANANASSRLDTNTIAIGYGTIGHGSNTVTIGNSSIVNNYFTGAIQTTGNIYTPKNLEADGNSKLLGGVTTSGGVVIGDSIAMAGKISQEFVTISANYTITSSDYIINTSTSGITITLPKSDHALTGQSRKFIIINASTGTVTLAPQSGDFVNVLTMPSKAEFTFYENGGGWTEINSGTVQ